MSSLSEFIDTEKSETYALSKDKTRSYVTLIIIGVYALSVIGIVAVGLFEVLWGANYGRECVECLKNIVNIIKVITNYKALEYFISSKLLFAK